MQKTVNFVDSILVSSGLKIKKKFNALRAARIGSVYVPDTSETDYAQLVVAAQNFLVPFNKTFGEDENGLDVRIAIDAALEKSILEQAQNILGGENLEKVFVSAKITVMISGGLDTHDSGYVIGIISYNKFSELVCALQQKAALDTSDLGILILASGENTPNNTVLAALWKNYHYSQQRITIVV